MSEKSAADRYHVVQFYIGTFEIMDRQNEEYLASCPYHFDLDGSDKEIETDARNRAEAIAAALNAVRFNWRPLELSK